MFRASLLSYIYTGEALLDEAVNIVWSTELCHTGTRLLEGGQVLLFHGELQIQPIRVCLYITLTPI